MGIHVLRRARPGGQYYWSVGMPVVNRTNFDARHFLADGGYADVLDKSIEEPLSGYRLAQCIREVNGNIHYVGSSALEARAEERVSK